MNPIRLSVVGCGAVVRELHAPALLALIKANRVRVIGCYDPDVKAAARAARRFGAQSFAAAVAPNALNSEAVLVATPPDSHFQTVETCLNAGCHVLVEKPFGIRISDAETLAEKSRTSGLSLLVGHFRRFLPSLNAARKLVKEGFLGPVTKVYASEGGRWEWGAISRYFVEDPAGGVIFDTGSHVLDSVLYVLGLDAPDQHLKCEISELSKVPSNEPSHEVTSRMFLRSKDGASVEACVSVSRRQALANVIRVMCERGSIEVIHSPVDVCFVRSGATRLAINRMTIKSPLDAKGCVALEYEDFIASCSDATFNSRLDSRKFLGLTGLAQSIAETMVTAEK